MFVERNVKMKKIMLFSIVALSLAAISHPGPFGRPMTHRGFGPRIHHAPPPPPRHHFHHSGFWPGVGIGLGAGLMIDALHPLPPPPPVVAPVISTGRVWVPPVYETRPVYDAFGRIVRYDQVLIRAGYWQ